MQLQLRRYETWRHAKIWPVVVPDPSDALAHVADNTGCHTYRFDDA